MWFYKVLRDNRCDVLGNSLAILTGLADLRRAQEIVLWIEAKCADMRKQGELSLRLPPCMFPFVQRHEADWHSRYEVYNQPGTYHNGGIWPFVCGFYVAALVAADMKQLAAEKLDALTELVRGSNASNPSCIYASAPNGSFGFNEWFRAQDGLASGQDWQTWSASMYLYAADCVESGEAKFFSAG